MQKENVKNPINTCHSKLDLESSAHAVAGNEQPAWKISYQVRDDVFINNGAFTLIELLVAVLIIGILTAVASSQYQKAVEKSRAMQAVTLVKTIGDANELYYLEHGQYAKDIDELAIQIPGKFYTRVGKRTQLNPFDFGTRCKGDWVATCIAVANRWEWGFKKTNLGAHYLFLRFPKDSTLYCVVGTLPNADPFQICKSLSNNTFVTKGNTKYYIVQ